MTKGSTPTRHMALSRKRSSLKRTQKNGGKGKAAAAPEGEAEAVNVPRSLVFRRGRAGQSVKQLVEDLRGVMSPNTARNLRERNNNTIADFRAAAAKLGVSHLLALSTGQAGGTLLRIARAPRGPSLSMRIEKFTLAKEVQQDLYSTVRSMNGSEFRDSPLVVLNNFDMEKPHLRLAVVTFQNMFPSIDVEKTKLKACRRVVLFQYDREREVIEFRHYMITATPTGINRNFKKLLDTRKPVSLRGAEDVADYLMQQASESERSEDESKVVLAQEYYGNLNTVAAKTQSEKSRVRLVELGPRLELTLMRVYEGFFDGTVLYSRFGDPEKETAAIAKQAQKLKAKRTVDKKRRKHEEEQKARDEKEKRRKENNDAEALAAQRQEPDDDGEWFRKEVGEEDPDSARPASRLPKAKAPADDGAVPKPKEERSTNPADEKARKRREVLKRVIKRTRPELVKKRAGEKQDQPAAKRQRS